MSSEARERLLRGIGCVLLLAALGWQIVRRGPLTLHAPRTAVSRTQPALEDVLVFFREAALRVPPGAEIALIPARPVSVLTPLMFHYLALGQFPRQRVLYAEIPHFPGRPPDYIGVYGAELEDPRFVLVARVSGGALYRRRP